MAGGYPFQPVDLSGSYIGDQPAQVVGTVASGVADDNSAPVKFGGVVRATSPTLLDGQRAEAMLTRRQHLAIELFGYESNSGVAGGVTSRGMSITANRLGAASVPIEFNGTTYDHYVKPYLVARILSAAATDNATLISSSACEVSFIDCSVERASPVYLRLYDKPTPPTAADIPKFTFKLPASGAFVRDLKRHHFPNGLAIRMTTGLADNDAGALAAGDVTCLQISVAK